MKQKRKPRVLLFPLGWKNIAKLHKDKKLAARVKATPAWVVVYKDDKKNKIFDRHPEKPLSEADDTKLHDLMSELVEWYRSTYVTYLVPVGKDADLMPAFHASISIDQARKSFEADGFEIIDCETAPNDPARYGQPPIDLDATLARVSKNLLWKQPVPADLRQLWKGQAAGDGVIDQVECGEVTLVDTLPREIKGMFAAEPALADELTFVGQEADGGIIGLWRYDKKVASDQWPAIHIDSEGMMTMPAECLQQLFEKRHRSARAWFKKRLPARTYGKRKLPPFKARFNVD